MDILEIIGGRIGCSNHPKLGEFAGRAVPAQLDVDSPPVADLTTGRLDEIAEYNETDAVTTHLLMLRIGLRQEGYAATVCGEDWAAAAGWRSKAESEQCTSEVSGCAVSMKER